MAQLFCDCKTDKEKANFFLSGRAVETGIIASAISNDVAMAYHRCAEFKKEIDALREREAALMAKLEAAEKEREEMHALIAAVKKRADAEYRIRVKKEEECALLQAKITEMERQEPVAYLPLSSARILESGVIANAVVWNCRDKAASDMPLYALPGAQTQGEEK